MTTLYHTLFVDRMYSLEHNMTAAPVIKGNTSGFPPTGASIRFQNGGCVKSAYSPPVGRAPQFEKCCFIGTKYHEYQESSDA